MKKTLHEFYRDLVFNHDWKHIAPFLDVITAVETEIHQRGLTAFTSHEMLRISPHAQPCDWFKEDMLYIMPDRSGSARVLYVSQEDNKKIGAMDFYQGGGLTVPYDHLIPSIIPNLERLARKQSP